MEKHWKIWIDTGGTFTDCIAYDPIGDLYRAKVLSSGRLRGTILGSIKNELSVSVSWPTDMDIFHNYILRIDKIPSKTFSIVSSDIRSGKIKIDKDPGVLGQGGFEILCNEEAPILAVRLVTGSTLDDQLPPINMRLGSTKGTNALLEKTGSHVGFITTLGLKDLLEVGTQQRPDLFALNVRKEKPLYSKAFEVGGRIDALGRIIEALDESSIARLISELKKAELDCLAICLMNSCHDTRHEDLLKKKLSDAGFRNISISSGLAKEMGIISRAQTTVVNAYLSGIIVEYLKNVKSRIKKGTLKVMSSAGGLSDADLFLPKDSLLSGPAGGVVGSVNVANKLGIDKILTFDMGGTSTDVSRFAGKYDYNYVTEINRISMFGHSLAIETVAAGGGSICKFDGCKLSVGPESAGAFPGPACYGNEGPLAITDINLLLGRIDERNFSIPLNSSKAKDAFKSIIAGIDRYETDEEILLGFLRVANEKMAEAIRKISISKGYNPSEYTLLAFGGAGGQHACAVADLLGIKKIIIPFDAGLLSAYGIGNAEIERIVSRQLLIGLKEIEHHLKGYFGEMDLEARKLLELEGISASQVYIRNRLVYLRFKGQENVLEVDFDERPLVDLFKKSYEQLYGHWLENEEIEIESIKLIAASRTVDTQNSQIDLSLYKPAAYDRSRCFVSGSWKDIPVFRWERLNLGARIPGPALLMSNNSTVFVNQQWKLSIHGEKNAILEKTKSSSGEGIRFSEKAELELFTNRFKSVADDMGAILQRTSFSVNVKDRLDFSCAVLNSKGYLVANAPHIPVHLGSLGVCVRKVMENLLLNAGDVVVTNHPAYGGSHLPDVTLIAPVFYEKKLVAFVCNRAHHAELGGITPGSMPANAKVLAEEGVVIEPAHLVKNHRPQWAKIKALLSECKYPTRALEENLADLNGALASVKTGRDGIVSLCDCYGRETVEKYMGRLLDYSGRSIFNTFKKLTNDKWLAEEFLDDGSRINVEISKSDSQIVFDFGGTSSTHPGNLNANLAILNSAVMYVLRLMLEEPLPLNEGIMKHVRIKVPECMLNPVFHKDPERSPAVVGGNTETSQRIVDTLLKALKLAACSQGTMNNLIFGNSDFGFYETIGGGAGAGSGFNGADAVHQHMTNTKITDPEVMEFRYPVVIESIGIRHDSGGRGVWSGGNGIVRQIRFKEDVTLTMLSQHRSERPYGMNGGEAGLPGKQVLIRPDGSQQVLKGSETIEVKKGDAIRVETPGGGGYGKPD
ncbi:MAG: hydantoinase B/oxoprolinase family protein [Cytophagales bacterium]|nr:hydantoinase B/oxoprolinase family protein [Cytophagales bacterium]